MKIAIQGHPTRGKEIIQILRSLGATSYGAYDTCSHPEWYWYINKNREITCDPKRSMCGYKLYTLEEFEKELPFKIGDKVITTDGTIGIIDKFKLEEDLLYCIKADVGGFYWCVTSTLKSYKEMKEERNITLTLEKAKEWYKKGGELREIALQAFTEKELNPLPRSWDEFSYKYKICSTRYAMPSKYAALYQLEQLRDCWRQGWKPNWLEGNVQKYVIQKWRDKISIETTYVTHSFLSFPTYEMAKEFLECFRDLIEKAGDLI